MQPTPSARLGIVRPVGASSRPIVAEIEARVLRHELARRLGPLVLDLRTDGPALGSWQPLAHAGWPGTIDARVDADALWAGRALTALAGRTIDPTAADVRARMLRHLGVIPTEPVPLDAARLAALESAHLRPTDLWLVATAASDVATGDPSVDALATPPTDMAIGQLDSFLDELVSGVADAVPTTASVAALTDEVAALRARVAELEADAHRALVDTTARLDELAHERDVLVDRAGRDRLDGASLG